MNEYEEAVEKQKRDFWSKLRDRILEVPIMTRRDANVLSSAMDSQFPEVRSEQYPSNENKLASEKQKRDFWSNWRDDLFGPLSLESYIEKALSDEFSKRSTNEDEVTIEKQKRDFWSKLRDRILDAPLPSLNLLDRISDVTRRDANVASSAMDSQFPEVRSEQYPKPRNEDEMTSEKQKRDFWSKLRDEVMDKVIG